MAGMNRLSYPAVVVFCLNVAFLAGGTVLAAEDGPVDAARWVSLLPENPRGVGQPISDRQAWQAVGAAAAFKDVVRQAEKLLSEPIPELTDDLYLDFSRTGNRERCQRVLGQRHSRFQQLVLAECIEDRGRFLPAIDEAIRAVCGDKTWVLPAHDGGLTNFKGTGITIDLRSSDIGWKLATARYWLGDKLGAETRKLIDDRLEQRVFTPFEKMVTTGKPRMGWLRAASNWNAVCLSGVTGAAMANIASRDRRAVFAAASERYVRHFLSGFTPDGYCSEGVGYWNYGFGHFVMLAETLRQATGSAVDLMDAANVRQIAMFGRRMEILPGLYPAFADCDPEARPNVQVMAFLSRRYGWGMREVERKGFGLATCSTGLCEMGVFGFPNSATATPEAKTAATPAPLRDWFSDAGVLICRPASERQHALGVAMKGGHNAEQHNHNDVGSFVVALGRSTPLVDPGAEIYTRRTFGKRRYESNVLNSFGHPVPRVADRLQETGRRAAARVLKTKFMETTDTFVLDLSAAYKVKSLKRLERTFEFSRDGSGKLTVTDTVEFDDPQAFGTALVTFGHWKQIDSRRLRIGEAPDEVIVEIVAEGGEIRVAAEPIREKLPSGRIPTRLGIDFAKPVVKGTIKMAVTPAS
jgi:hypothetical protein